MNLTWVIVDEDSDVPVELKLYDGTRYLGGVYHSHHIYVGWLWHTAPEYYPTDRGRARFKDDAKQALFRALGRPPEEAADPPELPRSEWRKLAPTPEKRSSSPPANPPTHLSSSGSLGEGPSPLGSQDVHASGP